jgi:hypothetical protein
MRKLVNGVEVEMSAQEEADFRASLARTLPMAKIGARHRIAHRAKQEQEDDALLDVANPIARVAAVRQNARQLWQTVQSCATVAEVDAVNIEAGW